MSTCLCLAILVAATLSTAVPSEPLRGRAATADAAPAVLRSELIEYGYVIAHARYVPPPYSLEVRGEDVLLNGYRISEVPVRGRWGGRSGRDRVRPGDDRSHPDDGPASRLERIERWLENDSVLIILDDGTLHVVRSDEANWLMQILNSDSPAETKAEYIVEPEDDTRIAVDAGVWRDLVHRFEPSDELRARLETELGPTVAWELSRDDPALPALMAYGLNVGGMVLVVLAFGTLLSRQPPRDCACHSCERCGDESSFLVRNIALVVVLSTFDLACTLIAGTTGEMLELNPLADPLVKSPAALAVFKLSATLTGASILVGLRRHRRAQVAAWWLCLVCSLLTFRWVAFHSLFVA